MGSGCNPFKSVELQGTEHLAGYGLSFQSYNFMDWAGGITYYKGFMTLPIM